MHRWAPLEVELLNAIKTELTLALHLSRDALHIHIGLALFVLASIAFRRRPGSWLPWFVVLGFELFNEMLDAMHWGFGGLHLDVDGAAKDIFNTMLWPTVIVFAARLLDRADPRTRSEHG